MKKISLRMRITLLTGIAIIVASLVTTYIGLHNYEKSIANVESIVDEGGYLPEVSAYGFYDGSGNEELIRHSLDDALTGYNSRLYAGIAASDRQFMASQFLWALFMTIVGMLASYVFSGIILKPIKRLAEDVENIGSIEKARPLAIYNKHDEIGILTKTFNDFIAKGKEYSYKQKLFASNVAHELKTPLAIMKAAIQVIDEDSDIEEYRESFALQEKNIDRLTDIINDLLVLKDNNLTMKKVRVDELIRSIIKEYESLINDKGIKINYDMQKLEIISDEGLLHRLIANLVANAIKYNKDQGEIFIDLDKKALTIRDTGIGIPEENLEDIFEPLFCVDKSRSKDLGGTGLGLSIVKDIADTLNYGIEVHSKLGYGSEFIIKFLKNQVE